MNHSTEQYDLIIIGSGESGHSAVKALQEQGKKALLIELEPGALMSTVQTKQQPSSSIGQPTEENTVETEEDTDLDNYISVYQQTIATPINHTVTYSFHCTQKVAAVDSTTIPLAHEQTIEVAEVEEAEVENIIDEDFLTLPPKAEPLFPRKQLITEESDDELEVVEPELIEEKDTEINEDAQLFDDDFVAAFKPASSYANDQHRFPPSQPKSYPSFEKQETFHEESDKDDSVHEQLIRRKYQIPENEEAFDASFSLSLDSLEFNDEQPPPIWEQKITAIRSDNESSVKDEPEPEDSFLDTLLDKPLPLERESRLRKRFMNKQRIEQQYEENESLPETTRQPPMFKTKIKPQMIVQEETPKPPQNTQTEVYNMEPFVSRRRTRTQKKKIMLTKSDALFETKSKKRRPHPLQKTLPEAEEENLYNFENSTMQPFMRPTQSKDESLPILKKAEPPIIEEEFLDPIDLLEEAQPALSAAMQNNDALKRDDIEFEEPYDGYNSWDEFVTPYTTNSRKRQELDQIEKRKIALRGLHNLINNLG